MRRHRFEPAPLLAGLLLFGAGVAYLLDAVGAVRLPAALLVTLVPIALVAGACTELLTYAVRYVLARRRDLSSSDRAFPDGP
jgi:hypothetical protein